MRTESLRLVVGTMLALAIMSILPLPTVLAQEATWTPSATQPSPGVWSVRERVSYARYSRNMPEGKVRVDQVVAETLLAYGLTSDLAIRGTIPAIFRNQYGPSRYDKREGGVGDIPVSLQWRFLREDFGPTDTLRLAAYAGVEIPTWQKNFSSRSFDPFAGLSMTTILGRHGLGANVQWSFNTGDMDFPLAAGESRHDTFYYNASYLYRLWPERYDETTDASWYLQAELNGMYETNGDQSILISPGLLYEATTWAAEISVSYPLWQHVNHRAKLNVMVTIGVRFLF